MHAYVRTYVSRYVGVRTSNDIVFGKCNYNVVYCAVYDETLMLTQLEPPTFDGGSPILGTGTPDQQAAKKQARRSTYQVARYRCV